jgi:hypothetical protein
MDLKKILVVFLAAFFLASSGFALEVGSVNLPDTLKAAGTDLVLNGAGQRTKLFIKAYVSGLYLKEKSSDAPKIIDADEPMAVSLQITSGIISSKMMEEAVREGFEHSTKGNIAPIKDKIDAFVNIFKAKINKGDLYEFYYLPGKGLEVYKNKALSSVIEGLDFKKALFGIWLGDKPAQADLKEKMLGIK